MIAQTPDATPVTVSIPDGARDLTLVLTAWRYADRQGHAASREWRTMGTTNSVGVAVDAAFVTGERVTLWREGIVALRCVDGYVYQFRFEPAPPPISGGASTVLAAVVAGYYVELVADAIDVRDPAEPGTAHTITVPNYGTDFADFCERPGLRLALGVIDEMRIFYIFDGDDDNFGYAFNIDRPDFSEWGYAPIARADDLFSRWDDAVAV